MKLQFELTEDDFLTFQLYMASQSTRVTKRRTIGRLFMLLIYMALGIWIWIRNGPFSGGVFFLVCLPLYFLYTWMDRRQFVSHFRKYIGQHMKDQLHQPMSVDFNPEQIRMSFNENESLIPMADIREIRDIPTLVLITLEGGQTIIIPKSALPPELSTSSYFKDLAEKYHLAYTHEPNWRWK